MSPYRKKFRSKKLKQNSQSHTITHSAKNMALEIDYEKLSKAVVEAILEAQKNKEQQEVEEIEQQRNAWLAFFQKNQNDGNLKSNPSSSQILKGLFLFKKENATNMHATYALLSICTAFMLWVYQWGLDIIALSCALILIFSYLLGTIKITLVICIPIAILCLIISRIVRIASWEAENLQDKNMLVVLFNNIVAFTAMLFSIIAAIIVLIK